MNDNDFHNIQKPSSLGVIGKIIIYLFFGAVIFLIASSISTSSVSVPQIELDNIENISPPIQNDTKGTEIIECFEINKVASFEITGRILATRIYNKLKVGYSEIDEISPIDMCIGWGKLSTDKYDYAIKFYELKDRMVDWIINDTRVITVNESITSLANTHLIPKTNEIKKQLEAFKKNDLIKIEGYLVDVYDTTKKFRPWETSRVRTDNGCEIILVEKVYKVVPKQ